MGFGYTNLSKVDTQWIDYFLINDDYRLNRADLSWAHSYWSGKKWDDNPHWELLVEGRGTIWGTVLRMRALEKIEAGWPQLLGQLEISRLAADLGSDLYNIAPFIFRSDQSPDSVRVQFCADGRDENDAAFWTKLGNHIRSLENSAVHWRAIELLRSSQQRRPDLTQEGVEFDLKLLSDEGRQQSRVESSRSGRGSDSELNHVSEVMATVSYTESRR